MPSKKKPKGIKDAKAEKKKTAARYYVVEKGSHYDFDVFETLEEALEYISVGILPNYEGEIPRPDEIVILFGETVPFEYEKKIEAKRP